MERGRGEGCVAGESQAERITEGTVVEDQYAPAWKHRRSAFLCSAHATLFSVAHSHNGAVYSVEREGNPVTMAMWDRTCSHSSLDREIEHPAVKNRFLIPRC